MRFNPDDFVLCMTPSDYKLAYQFVRSQRPWSKEAKFLYPTIVALKDDKIVGVIARTVPEDHVIVGNLTVSKDLSRMAQALLVLRLIEVIEQVFRNAGVKFYWANVDKKKPQFAEMIKRALGAEPVPHPDDTHHVWYKRVLADG